MAKTKDDLVKRVLGRLGAIQAGQDPSAEDVALVEGQIDPVLDDLALRNVYYINDPESIPEAQFHWLARLLAAELGPDYGKGDDDAAVLLCEARLRQLAPVALPGAMSVEDNNF